MDAAYAWLVAEPDGVPVGYAYGSRHRERAAYGWAADVAVYISAEHHRAGVGRALYTRLFQRLREIGLWTLCAGVTEPNAASNGLHRSMGFVSVGTYRRIGWKAGAWHDVQWWQLDLRPGDPGPPGRPRYRRGSRLGPLAVELRPMRTPRSRYAFRGPPRTLELCSFLGGITASAHAVSPPRCSARGGYRVRLGRRRREARPSPSRADRARASPARPRPSSFRFPACPFLVRSTLCRALCSRG